MNFGDLRTLLGRRIRDTSLADDVADWFNEVQELMLQATAWRHFQDRLIIPTTGPYTTGTVTVTNGQTAVVGAGTAWDQTMVGQLFKMSTASGTLAQYYVIASVTNATNLTLDSIFVGTTGAGQTYSIYYYQVASPSNLEPTRVLNVALQFGSAFNWPLSYIGESALFNVIPNEVYSSQRPWLYRLYGSSNIQLFPPPQQQMNLSVWFMRVPTSIPIDGTATGNEVIDWPSIMHRTILKGVEALAWAYLHDTNDERCWADFQRRLAQHVKQNNKIPLTGMQLESWDGSQRSDARIMQYPSTINT